jgi:autotransporter-associated beta strand protein
LATNGNAGLLNKIHNGTTNAILTINTQNNTVFAGTIADGTSGQLSIIKNGTGIIELIETNSYTGTTTINNGVIKLNKPDGNTINGNSSLTINGGELQINTNQTLKNIYLNGGVLKIDSGVTLTITGSYNVGSLSTTTIINNGTIKINCNSLQNFPGTTVTVSMMNNLIADNVMGVHLNNDLNVSGILDLASGAFTVGNHLLTINNPITIGSGTLIADNTSSLKISGTALGIVIPANVNQLKNLTVNNTQGTVLQADLSIFSQLFIEDGLVLAGENISLNGPGNVVMTGGELRLLKNGVVLPELTGTYSLTGGAIVFAGIGIGNNAQTIRAVNYYDLISVSGGDRILSTTGTIGIGNQFIPANNYYEVNGSIIDFNKSGNQDVPSFDYYHLKLSGSSGATKFLIGNISIRNFLTLSTDTRMALHDYDATLLSDSVMTASVGYIPTANSFVYNGSGRFIVNRYIPVGVSHPKSWQFLAVPDFGGTLKSCWQEGNNVLENNNPNFGTTISGGMPGAVSRGFDFYSPSGSSVKYYNSNGNNWIGIDDGVVNTESFSLANINGYMVFVRGDRSVQTYNGLPVSTTLRTKGKLYSTGTDAPATISVPTGQIQSVGNPYASAINFTSLLSTSSNIDSKFYVWDPLLPGSYGYGGFQTISSVNGYRPIPGGTENYNDSTSYTNIQSGQAFFVYSTPGGDVNFSESNKETGSTLPFRNTNAAVFSSIRVDLFNANDKLTDGNAVLFSDSFSDTFDANDAIKINNFSESFSIVNNGKKLVLDTRKPVLDNDTIFYKINQLKQQQYHFHFESEAYNNYNQQVFLKDNYLSVDIPIDLNGTDYSFIVSNDSASFSENRFYLFFKTISVLPISEFQLSGVCNDNHVSLIFNAVNENNVAKYILQKSTDGFHFSNSTIFTEVINNGGDNSYPFLDFIHDNLVFYRVDILLKNGRQLWSNTLRIVGQNNTPIVNINPNPITNNQIHFSISGMPEGVYKCLIYNLEGRLIEKKSIQLQKGINDKVLKISSAVAKGNYCLKILNQKVFFTVE